MNLSSRARPVSGVALLVAAFSIGCSGTPDSTSPDGGGTSTPTSTSPTTTPTSAPTTGPTASSPTGSTSGGGSAASVAGDYTSASCGKRTYPRELSLGADGHFTASDLVSPCPPKAVCVWSGIVVRQGTYTTNGASVTLVPDGAAAGPGEPLATELAFDHGVPVEDSDHSHCVYAKAAGTAAH